MASSQQKIALSFVYLILSGPQLALAGRVVVDHNATSDMELTADTATKTDSQWCNPFSRMRTKFYKFEIHNDGDDCSVGGCTAVEFVRDRKNPLLIVHHEQSWTVKLADDDEAGSETLDWDLVDGTGAGRDEEYNIYDAESVAFGEANEEKELREYVEFTWKDKKTTRITGGLFLKGGLIRRGIEKITENDAKREASGEVENGAHALDVGRDGVRNDHIVKHGAKQGAKVTAGVASVGAIGFGIAATTIMSVELSTTAVLGAALAATLGGAVVGAAIGAVVGVGAGVAAVVGLYKSLRDRGITGAEKLWEKLYCMDFDVCYTRAEKDDQRVTLMVVDGSKCPKKPKEKED